ncbi:phosphodiester glycosidase family protein [Clostridium paraputrificum]|uniref:phosphodiester glycosidase family protein n=1 Tax=Clostridium TaxID=1485 RepID=UPI003D324FA7
MKKIEKKSVNKNNKKRRKFSWKMFLGFLVFMIVFTAATAPFVLLYGPFEQAKRTYVGSAMGTMSHQWLATMFLSDEKIAEIIGSNESQGELGQQDLNLINIPTRRDDTIIEQTLDGKNGAKFIGHVLIVKDPKRVKVGVSSKIGTMGESTSRIAENYDAIAAINGGAFTDEQGAEEWTSNGGIPSGILISEGKDMNNSATKGKQPVAAINKDGKLIVGDFTYDELLKEGVTDALSFGLPNGGSSVLIYNGRMRPISGDGGLGTSPKTMIGQRADGSIILVALDSKIPATRIAATVKEAQEVMYELQCVTAMLLDGGRSTTMYYDGEVINEPSNTSGERPIASAFIVK